MESHQQHVEYALLAEFDIDKGASLKYQYPTKTGTDEHILSELMLPDGAHLRAEDWTIFCLNQTIPDVESDNQCEREKPLLYVLNLVRTKHDATARRGAHVKAMAICTKHQFLHIYKPVLLLAMEKYFENPSEDVLKTLYKAVNSMDISRMPQFTWHERQILRTSDNKAMFEEMFIDDNATVTSPTSIHSDQQAKWADQLGDSLEDEASRLRRGTFIDLASGKEVQPRTLGKDRRFFETKIEYEGIKLPIRVPLTANDEEVGDFSLINLIRTFSPPPSQPGSPNPHHPHLDSPGLYTHPIMLLLNALLTQKRIVFLGYGHPSGEVANYVLAACALGSGCGTVLRGFTERAFPYTNLTSIDDLLKCPGFIAGVTNPTYEEHTAWWDVLCNISTGKITVSKDIDLNHPEARHGSMDNTDAAFSSLTIGRSSTVGTSSTSLGDKNNKERDLDTEFITDVMSAVHSHYGEAHVRAKFQEYVVRFVRLAAAYEQDVYHTTKIEWPYDPKADPTGLLGHGSVFPDEVTRQRELLLNASRIEGWRKTISYRNYQKGFQTWVSSTTLNKVDVCRQVSKLKALRNIPEPEMVAILEAFLTHIVTDQNIIEFLSYLPQYQGGLGSIGVCLLHSSLTVRQHTVDLLNRLSRNPTGHRFIQNLPRFQKLTYERLAREMVPIPSS